jgi:hypothetical protein
MAFLVVQNGPSRLTVGIPDEEVPESDMLLLSASDLSAVLAKVQANTQQWQDFQGLLDDGDGVFWSGINSPIGAGDYQGGALGLVADYALGYLCLKDSNPTTAAAYADKAIAAMRWGLRDDIKQGWGHRSFVARGDGVTTVFDLPFTDNINASTFKVFLGSIFHIPVTKGSANGQDTVDAFARFLKVSNTSDGSADYTESVITSRAGSLTWSGGDWRQNPDYSTELIDWSGSGSEPSAAATYYVTVARAYGVVQQGSGFTLNAGAGTVTFNTAPTTSQAVWVEYLYGTATQGASTLAYQQTGTARSGFNNILLDTTYPSRYLGRFLAIGYDWLYDYAGFSADLKAEVSWMLGRWSDFVRDSGFFNTVPSSNYGAGGYVSRVNTAIAKDRRDAGGAASLLAEVASYRTTYTLPLVTDPPDNGLGTYKGGYWGEGFGYGDLSSQGILLAARALEVYGQAVITAERAWAAEEILVLLHAQPTDDAYSVASSTFQGTICEFGDLYAYPPYPPYKPLYYLLASLSSDAAATAYCNSFIQNVVGLQLEGHLNLIYRDPSAAVTDWTGVLPLHYRSEGCGVYFAREDWSYNTTWIAFLCGNVPQAFHQHFSQGCLLVKRGADSLLVSPDSMAQTHYNSRSTYENLVIVDDNGDGEQIYRYQQGVQWDWYGDPGVIELAYDLSSANYFYASGEYKAAYSHPGSPGNGGAATELQRSVFYVRPDVIVVHDRATTKQTSYTKRLQWFTRGNPTTSGDGFSHTVGSSKVIVTVTSGSAITTTETNFTYGALTDIYRVDTQLTSANVKARFCSVIQTGSSGASAYTVTRVVSSGGHFEGVIVNGTLVVLFGETAGPVSTAGGKSYDYTGTNAATITHYVADLTPSQSYTLSGAASGSAVATSGGVITFTTTGTGASQTVTIT